MAQKTPELRAYLDTLNANLGTAPDLQLLRNRGAVFVVNHSGGKDSQATTIAVQRMLPAGARIVLVHAILPEADWDGIEDHIRASHPGLKLYTCTARWADGSTKTFLDMVAKRGMWPSPQVRQCTSDLKRTPIEVVIRQICQEFRAGLVVSIDGRRADESTERRKLPTWTVNERLSKNPSRVAPAREVYDWLPIHAWSKAEVFAEIAAAGQQPHWAYAAGMSRLSCCFCVMGRKDDLRTAARLRPELFQRYVAMEQQIGQSFAMPDEDGTRHWLLEIVGQVQAETDQLLAA